MMRLSSCLLMTVVFSAPYLYLGSAPEDVTPALDRAEARAAFEYLTKVRADMPAFSKEMGVALKEAKPVTALAWNDILASVAERKALDMATRDYYGHVTPEGIGINIMIHEAGYTLPDDFVKDKTRNYFESIASGYPTGKEVIKALILDKGNKELGHRKHLLGLDAWNKKHKEIGVGFARNPKSINRFYSCVIIAHH